MGTELKNCPFCGAEAVAPTHDDEFEAWRCGCSMCNGHTWADTEAEAIAAWNTRAPLPATQEDAERSGVDDLVGDLKVTADNLVSAFGYTETSHIVTLLRKAARALSTPAMSDRQEYDGEAVREALDKLAVKVLHSYRKRDGLTCYKYDHNRQRDERYMRETFAELVAPFIAALAHPAQAPAQPVDETERLRTELAEARETIIAFAGPWAAQYARDFGLPDGHLHPTHYDILVKAGARMDGFTRAALANTDKGEER